MSPEPLKQTPPVFGGNPGSFRQAKHFTVPSVAIEVARKLGRGALREAYHATIVGVANLGNQWFGAGRAPRFRCSCCGRAAHSLVHLSNRLRIAWHSSCPQCDSRSRHRGLALLIPKILAASNTPQRALHFAPEVVLKTVLLKLPNLEYRTTDYFVEDVDYPKENIEALSFPPASFDVLLCNHVLEHIPDDEAAFRELSRILKPEGVAVITIPGEWNRNTTVTFPTTDLNGHYRDYGADVKDRFLRYFASVEMFDMHQLDKEPGGLSYGIRPGDVAFICRQPRPTSPRGSANTGIRSSANAVTDPRQ